MTTHVTMTVLVEDRLRLEDRVRDNNRSPVKEFTHLLDALEALERGYNIAMLLAALEPAPDRQSAMDAARKEQA